MKKTMLNLMILAVALACVSPAAYATKATVESNAVAMIAAPDGLENRLLVKFDTPVIPDGQEVMYADIQFHTAGMETQQEIELFELAADWDAGNVTWAEGWAVPGGDTRAERRRHWIADERSGDLVKFVVTESVSRFLSGHDTNYGFLILSATENSKQVALPADVPILTIYSRPKRNRQIVEWPNDYAQ